MTRRIAGLISNCIMEKGSGRGPPQNERDMKEAVKF
jgi:hypothetical protein